MAHQRAGAGQGWPGACSWHRPDRLSCAVAIKDEEQRMACGEEQRVCEECDPPRWFWAHEWGCNSAEAPCPAAL